MNPDEDEEPWRTPENLFDRVELEVHRVLGDDEGCEGPDWHGEVLLSILLPDLRKALREAGVDLPESGPFSREAGSLLEARRRAEAEAAEAAAEAADTQETALYRWYDKDDVLLYIGIAGNLGSRTKGHVRGSSWMVFVARSSVERLPRRSTALAAEEAAIKAEGPVFNQQHNNTPEARERLRAYLEAAGRMDMLTAKMRATIEEDKRLAAAAEALAASRPQAAAPLPASEDDGAWDEWRRADDRWTAEAEGQWWRPWLGHRQNGNEPDDTLQFECPVYSDAEVERHYRWLQDWKEREGWAHPMAWASFTQTWGEAVGPALFGCEERWSAHSDNTFSRPWETWTPEIAAIQDELIAALVAAGKCSVRAAGERIDLEDFSSRTEARVAGAILCELSWGHKDVARQCAALLRAERHPDDPDRPAEQE